MALILFLIILSALVLVHELGHFGAAKFFGVRVDEFGLGYPPRAAKLFNFRGTDFTLNWLPFGGFVKIFGENMEESEKLSSTKSSDNFQNKNRGIQATILAAGVVGNFLFAWLLLSFGFMVGLPALTDRDLPIQNPHTVITEVLSGSPADQAGFKIGDEIVRVVTVDGPVILGEGKVVTPEIVSRAITSSRAAPITFHISRAGVVTQLEVLPQVNENTLKPMVGIGMETLGTVKLPFYSAVKEGFYTTWVLTLATAEGLGKFLSQAVVGKADFSSVAGPVGLVGIVGDVSQLGFRYLIAFTALISLNLCIINLMPFPALDGGRLLFVGIEAVTRKQIPARLFNIVNSAGFAFLILLMILITIHDVGKIF